MAASIRYDWRGVSSSQSSERWPNSVPMRAGQASALLPGHDAEHGGGAAGGVEDPGEDLDRGGLPRAVGSDVGEALARFDGERDAPDGLHGAPGSTTTGLEGLRQPADLDRHPATVPERWGRSR